MVLWKGHFFMGHLENVEPLGLMVMVALVYCTVTSLSIENLSRTPINGPICDNRCLLVRPSTGIKKYSLMVIHIIPFLF